MNLNERTEVLGFCSECGEVGEDYFLESVDPAPDVGPFRGGWWSIGYAVCNQCKTCCAIHVERSSRHTERPIEFRQHRYVEGTAHRTLFGELQG
jgi:hypothetical protein